MSSWEDRFDAVVRETERNLAKIQQKSTPEKPVRRYERLGPATTTKFENCFGGPMEHYSLPVSAARSPKRTEIWKQGDELEKLRRQVTLLQQSNTQYEQEAKTLKHQVSLLKKQTVGRKKDPTVVSSTSLEMFKREVWEEMRSLKQELASAGSNTSDKELATLRKDLDTARLKETQDFQELKNDVDSMRNRMMKVELMVKSVVTDCKECLRKCQRLGSEASHFSETVRLQHRSVLSQLQSLSDNCAHLPVLRSSLSDIDGRLSSIERSSHTPLRGTDSATPASLRDSTGTRGSSYLPETKKSKPLNDHDLSFDDLSIISGIEDTVDISTSTTYKQDKSLSESFVDGDPLSAISDLALSDEEEYNLLSS